MEGVYNSAEIVGNRPHYPLLVVTNMQDRVAYEGIQEKTESIWPQLGERILYASYQEDLQLKEIQSAAAWSHADFQAKLDAVKRDDSAFAEMNLWCVYNLIDTASMKALDDFKKSYQIIAEINRLVVDKTRTMAVVLLDDTITSRELAQEIREYICDQRQEGKMPYDGTVVISNRGYKDQIFDLKEMISVAANVIILSNNDAVGDYDDDYFRNIVGALYSNSVLTIAYAYKERPNEEIALQIYSELFRELERLIQNPSTQSMPINWQQKLGIYAGRIQCVNDYISHQPFQLDLSPLKYLPLKKMEGFAPDKIASMPYGQYIGYIWENSLHAYVRDNILTSKAADTTVQACMKRFEEQLLENVSAQEMAQLREQEIEDLFSQGQLVAPTNSTVFDYIKGVYENNLQKETINPMAKRKLREYIETSRGLRATVSNLIKEFNTLVPVGRLDSMGILYLNMTQNYLASDQGKKRMARAVSPAATYSSILDEFYAMTTEIIDQNKEIFELSFIKEWEQRISASEADIYTTLSRIINDQLERKIFLHGNFAANAGISVYMFRTHSISMGSRTASELLSHFQTTLGSTAGVQYFNTGSDNTLEVMKLIDLPGSNIRY